MTETARVRRQLIQIAAQNLRRQFPEADPELVQELVAEAFDHIDDGRKYPALVGMLAERHVHAVLERERRDAVCESAGR